MSKYGIRICKCNINKIGFKSNKNFVRKGVKAAVKDAFDEEESIDEWIENNNDELEALSQVFVALQQKLTCTNTLLVNITT